MQIFPQVFSSEAAVRDLRDHITCPLCKAQTTKESSDIGWVSLDGLVNVPKWICFGCWIDVTRISRLERPSADPYYGDLTRLAAISGKGVDVIQVKLLRKQLHLIESSGGKLHHKDREQLSRDIADRLNTLDPGRKRGREPD